MSFACNALKLFNNRYIRRYISYCVQLVPEITVIGYAQNQAIGKPNDLKSLGGWLSMAKGDRH